VGKSCEEEVRECRMRNEEMRGEMRRRGGRKRRKEGWVMRKNGLGTWVYIEIGAVATISRQE